jgi:magnesium-transporting ATPase (P-type)
MRPDLVAVFLAVAFMAILTMMAVQLSWWRRGHQVITAGQLISRMVYASVILGVLVMMFIGRFLLRWESARAEVVYWLGILVIVILIAVVAAGDWRRILQLQEQKQLQMYRELVEAMRRGVLRKKGRQRAPEDQAD